MLETLNTISFMAFFRHKIENKTSKVLKDQCDLHDIGPNASLPQLNQQQLLVVDNEYDVSLFQ